MHIIRHIKKLLKSKPTLFATPGHMQGFHTMNEFGKLFGKKLFSSDLAEIQSMDNLQNPKGAILQSRQRAAEIYNSKSTFYLVNGSSSGIIALMLATAKEGDKVLIARNCHKSVINALILSGAIPVWALPEWNQEWGIFSSIKPETIKQKLQEHPDIKAVWVTSPTYEGVASDVKAISKVCNHIPFIVDESHGALWPFSDQLPQSAVHLGADACLQSLHKTGSCLNQGAVLHISKASKITPERVQSTLNLINTTSPSYILLSSIEASVEYLNSAPGRNKLDQLINNIAEFKKVVPAVFLENSDPTKIFFRLDGISGDDVSDFLEEKCNIELELNNEIGLLALTGIGTSKNMLKKLQKSIQKAAKTLKKIRKKTEFSRQQSLFIEPIISLSPRQAFAAESGVITPGKALGRINTELIVKYPPGIPILIPGEVLQEGHLVCLAGSGKIEIVI